MSQNRPTKTYFKRDIDKMLEVLRVLETNPEAMYEYQDWEPMPEYGGKVLHVPYWNYGPPINRYIKLAYFTSCYIDPYKKLPEDSERVVEDGMDTIQEIRDARDAQTATIDQVRRYLVLCIRGEKFCNGYLARQLRDGTFLAVLRRLRHLREQLS